MICIRYKTSFSEKRALRCAPLLKITLGRKKTTKSENSEISPSRCALWVHILVRPFWGSKALIYVCRPLVCHTHDKELRRYTEGCTTEFSENAHFQTRFPPKKVPILVTNLNLCISLSIRSQNLRLKYDIGGILNIETHSERFTVFAHRRHTTATLISEKNQFSTIFDQVLFLVGAFWGAALFGK